MLSVSKNQRFKWTYGNSGNDYKVATFSRLYLTTGITRIIGEL